MMFKIPEWEDVSKLNITFEKENKKKKKTIHCSKNVKENNLSVDKKPYKKNELSVGKFVINPRLQNASKKRKSEQINQNIIVKAKSKRLNNCESSNLVHLNTKNSSSLLKGENVNDLEIIENSTKSKIKSKSKHKSRSKNRSASISKEVDNSSVISQIKIKSKSPSLGIVRTKDFKKKEKIRKLLKVSEIKSDVKNNPKAGLRERMLEKLKAAQFRFINEKLYTSSGQDAHKLFQEDPAAFRAYHQGYQLQLNKWPINPLDVIVQKIIKMPKSYLIADMGCGEGTLAKRVPQTVRSFDLVAAAPEVEECDMAHTPLLAGSVDVAVYCLALMGTNLTQYLVEANRVLKDGGQLMIAEVESRFENLEEFLQQVQKLGFKVKAVDKTHQVFYFLYFTKVRQSPVKKSKLPNISLNPCIYKKR